MRLTASQRLVKREYHGTYRIDRLTKVQSSFLAVMGQQALAHKTANHLII
jgi:hypothetical protein